MIRLSTIDRFGARADAGPVLRHVGDAVADGLAGRAGSRPPSPPIDHAAAARAQPGDDLGQLALAVAGDGGDAQDLAGADVERDAAQRRQAAVVLGRDVLARRGRRRPGWHGVRSRTSRTSRPTISGRARLRDAVGRPMPAAVTFPRRMTVIRSAIARTSPSLWLMKTTLRPSAVIDRSVRNSSSISCGREDRRRLVHDQDPRAAVEHLEDLDPLLLADGELPDLGPRVDAQAEPRRELADLVLGPAQVGAGSAAVEAEQDVLGDRLRRDEREVLVDHPEPGRDRVARRAERDRLPVEPDLARRPAGRARRGCS